MIPRMQIVESNTVELKLTNGKSISIHGDEYEILMDDLTDCVTRAIEQFCKDFCYPIFEENGINLTPMQEDEVYWAFQQKIAQALDDSNDPTE